MRHPILIVDDESRLREVLAVALENMGHEALTADSAESALAVMDRHEVHLVLSDLRLPGLNGRDLLTKLKERRPEVPVIIITAYASLKDAVELIKAGAFDYIVKPFDLHALEAAVAGALRFFSLGNDNLKLRKALRAHFSEETLVGKSRAMDTVRQSIAEVSVGTSTVLIIGESGTGKELVAKAVHYSGPRASAPLVTVNCAAIPEALLESELFGHVKGAFTGATVDRPGRFAQADGGSLFLDEIGDMPLSLQAKVLRGIQEKTIDPVGAGESRQVDVRIIAATNRDLSAAVDEGSFRRDLYYRLNVYPIYIPPLRERVDDIPLLLEHFATRLAERMGKSPLRVDAEGIRFLQNYPWPGNVRELENCVERLTIVAGEAVLGEEQVAVCLAPPLPSVGAAPLKEMVYTADMARSASPLELAAVYPLDLQSRLEEFERELVLGALERSGGVQVKAAELLGISERSIWHRIKKLGIRIKKEVV